MSAKAQARVEQAMLVADYLDSIGEKKRANDVRSLCRANSSYRVTLAQLHGDNMELRNRFALGEQALIERGAPTEEGLAISLEAELFGDLKDRFEKECSARGMSPSALLADILTAVIRDDLFAAVIDA